MPPFEILYYALRAIYVALCGINIFLKTIENDRL